ncbi:MFS transporter [Actinoplanes sp. NEAU-A12]|uniref:MFS transporter n=1 Tax=Actinoplanes sandaracinus TaxID=3045177 RepID=A0ABT6WTD7_9ACTN|nr:MFS transporter [Actinoplanes sandaracinus]MDI6103006.1 MFS transporter [Actinoplanes sandaracinus]
MTVTQQSVPRRPAPREGARDFRLFATGDLVSQLGSQVTLFALPLLAVTVLSSSGAGVGLLQACYTVPFFVLPLFAGVWVERRARRPIMIGLDAGRAALVLSIPVAAALDVLSLPLLCVAALAGGAMTVGYDVAAAAYLPRLVAPAALDRANSRILANQAVGATTGPALAGWMASLIGLAATLLADFASYLVAMTMLLLIRRREPAAAGPAAVDAAGPAAVDAPQRRNLRRELSEGLRAVLGNPPVRAVALHAAVYNAGIELITVAFLIHFVHDLGYGGAAYGVVLTLGGVGAIIGALTAPALIARVGYGRALLTALVFSTTVYFVLPAAGGSVLTATALCGAAFLIGCAGAAAGGVVAVTVRQRTTAPELHARMTATYRLIALGAVPIAAAVAGVLADTIGARATLWLAPIVLLLSVLPATVAPLRRLRQLPD